MEGGGPLGFSPRSKDRLLDDLREVEAQINAVNDKMLELQRRLEPPALPKKNLVINIDTGAANLAAKENDFFSKRSSDFARQTIAEDMARIQAIQDSARAAMDRLNEEMASDAVRMEMAYANRVRVVQEAANAEIISEQKKADLLLKLEEDLNRDRMALQRAYQHQMLGSYADIFGSLSEIVGSGSKKAFELSKNLARAQAMVSTYSAAQKAFESQIIPGDPTSLPRAYAAAAAAVLAGVARVTAINRTSFSGGGGGAGGGAAPVYLADSQTNLPIPTRRDSDVASSNVNITIQAIDTDGAMEVLQKNRAVITNIVQGEYDRRGAVGGPIR